MLEFLSSNLSSPSFVAALLLGLIAPAIGIFLVVRRFSLLADTLAHVSLVGVALAVLFKFSIFWGALGAAFFGGVGMEWLRRTRKVVGDAVLALFLSGSLALALVVAGVDDEDEAEFFHAIFGSLESVTWQDTFILLALLVAAIVFFLFFYRQLFLTAMDEDLARVSGIKTYLLNGWFILLAASIVAGSLQILGALLIGALMIIPVLSAMEWRVSFRKTFFLSILFSIISVVFGFLAARYFHSPLGATIVLAALGIFALSAVTRALGLRKALI